MNSTSGLPLDTSGGWFFDTLGAFRPDGTPTVAASGCSTLVTWSTTCVVAFERKLAGLLLAELLPLDPPVTFTTTRATTTITTRATAPNPMAAGEKRRGGAAVTGVPRPPPGVPRPPPPPPGRVFCCGPRFPAPCRCPGVAPARPPPGRCEPGRPLFPPGCT